jgi:hypothetical protein
VYVNGALIPLDRQRPLPVRAHPGWHALGVLLVVCWLMVMGSMFAWPGEGGGARDLSSGDLSGVLADEEEWLGAYSRGRKIGYIRSKIKKSGELVTLEQETALKIRLSGIKQEIHSWFSADLGTDSGLRGFEFRFHSGLLSARAEGRVEKNRLVVKARLGSETVKRVLPLRQAPLFDLTVLKLLAARELKAGDRYRVTVFDPQTLSNRPVEIGVVGLEVVKVQGGMQPAIHLRRTLSGQPVDTWIDARGAVLMETTAFGLTLRREDRETAEAEIKDEGLAPEVDAADLLRLLAPESPKTKEEP